MRISSPDGSNQQTGSRYRNAGQPFAIQGGAEFVPYYHPQKVVEVKERTPSRNENFCDGEDVSDNGSKNREFTVIGRALRSELADLTAIGDHTGPLTLVSSLFSGEVFVQKVKKKDTHGGWDPFVEQMTFEYTLDILSSGLDEGHSMTNGIISGPGEDASQTTEVDINTEAASSTTELISDNG